MLLNALSVGSEWSQKPDPETANQGERSFMGGSSDTHLLTFLYSLTHNTFIPLLKLRSLSLTDTGSGLAAAKIFSTNFSLFS